MAKAISKSVHACTSQSHEPNKRTACTAPHASTLLVHSQTSHMHPFITTSIFQGMYTIQGCACLHHNLLCSRVYTIEGGAQGSHTCWSCCWAWAARCFSWSRLALVLCSCWRRKPACERSESSASVHCFSCASRFDISRATALRDPSSCLSRAATSSWAQSFASRACCHLG